MKRILFLSLACVMAFSLLLTACGKTPSSTTSSTTSTTTAPVITSSTAPVSTSTTTQVNAASTTQVNSSSTTPTTTAVSKYGGIYRQALNAGLTTPIGYPPEATPDSGLAAAPALESLIGAKKDGTIVPVLATAWKVSNDGKSLVLSLRKGVKFHDGSDFNADVCKWNMDLEIVAKRALEWLSVDKVDDYTIRININSFKNTTLSGLAGTTQMISKATFDKQGIEYSRWHPIGTGPFIFVEYQRDASLTYKRNPNYWDTGLPYLDGLKYSVITDSTVRKLAFQKGDLHMLTSDALEAQELQKAGYPVATSPGGTFVLIPCSTVTSSPWSFLKVRQAASYAIDREGLAKALGFGFANPAYQIYPGDQMAAIPNFPKTQYNPAKARQLLAEAGFPNGFSTTIHSWVYIVPANWVNAIAAQLDDVGINVTTDFPEVGKYMSDATAGWSDGIMAGAFINSPGNANTILDMYLRGYYYSSMKRSDAVLSALATSLASPSPDPKLIQAVVQAMNDDMTAIPFLEQVNAVFYQKGVHDEVSAEYGMTAFLSQYAWLEPSIR